MRILLIGGYGFIGSAIAQRLIASGHDLVCFGRSVETGRRVVPAAQWVSGDLNHMLSASDWAAYLENIDAVVNASGALQSGAGERLDAIQGHSIVALIAACANANVARFVQISAVGADARDPSPFLSTKAMADNALRASALDWSILRPGLVIGRNAYGGTLLVRALAALPWAVFTVHGAARVRTVALSDVAEAVRQCLALSSGQRIDADLVERPDHSLRNLILRHRAWLGIAPPRFIADLTAGLARVTGLLADMLGQLGWRSPLRSTAMQMVARDIDGDPEAGETLLGRPLLTLDQTLAANPSGLQDRWQARLFLLLPAMVGSLALLFLLSGIVSLARLDQVTVQLDGTLLAGRPALLLGILGALADIALGAAILIRRWARRAALGMALLSAAYLAMGSWVRPDMWVDPLAPLAKAVTALVLALVAYVLLEER